MLFVAADKRNFLDMVAMNCKQQCDWNMTTEQF